MTKLNNHNIIKITLIIFILSFSLIYYIEMYNSPPIKTISNIKNQPINTVILFKANISKQNLNNQTLFLTLLDNTSQISAVAFKQTQKLNLNTTYLFKAKVTNYNQEKSLIILSAKKLN